MQGAPLAGAGAGGEGFARRLAAAADGVAAAIATDGPASAAPLFASADGAAWRDAAVAAGDADPGLLAGLAAGRTGVVVTGQQPGFLGGPLLTLHKVATAIAIAQMRSDQGRPTVAAFWCGDDDEDLIEALAPVGFLPQGGMVTAAGREAARAGRLPRRMVGPTRAREWCAPGARLLAAAAQPGAPGSLAADLAALWEAALAADWDWSRLNVAALRRIFAGHPLLVVRGNDPLLHGAAGPFYARLDPLRERCRELAGARGRELAAAGEPVPVNERSLRRHLFRAQDGRRLAVAPGEPAGEPRHLRPGVMLRSAVQDWLLSPVAVVVGPGEMAYLEQLEAVHATLGVPRAPLAPRLFGWVLRPGDEAPAVAAGRGAPVLDAAGAARLAAEAAAAAERDLAARLGRALGLPADRAQALARGRARRWQRSVAAMAAAEARRHVAARDGDRPAWLWPEGYRQERRLAAAAAAAILGDGLAPALVGAARAHLEGGACGRWHEYIVRPEPASGAGPGREP